MAKVEKYVYSFGPEGTDGNATMKALLGGKGANLAEMTNLGLPVPAGFTIGTNVCTYFYDHERAIRPSCASWWNTPWPRSKRRWGPSSARPPIPCSSPAAPGPRLDARHDGHGAQYRSERQTVEALAKESGNERFAWDSYRRFVQMYGDVVLDMKPKTKTDDDPFEELLEAKKHAAGVKLDNELSAAQLKELVAEFKKAIKDRTGHDFPTDPMDQVWGADRRRLQ